MRSKLGQHFLKDKNKIKKILEFLDVQDGDYIIEIGAGHGELTEPLSDFNVKLFAIEKDEALCKILKTKFGRKIRENSIEMICGDAIEELPRIIEKMRQEKSEYKIIGNIPYYITGYVFRILGDSDFKPNITVLLIQKEVGERVCAGKGNMNLLAASVQFWGIPKIVNRARKELFSPRPKVDSVVIRIDKKNESFDVDARKYYKFINILFKHPRKTIKNNLISSGIKKDIVEQKLRETKYHENARPHQLDVEDIIHLCASFDV